MSYDVCRHGGLRRKCETCDLAEDLVDAQNENHAMLALLREAVEPMPAESWSWVTWSARVAKLLKRLDAK